MFSFKESLSFAVFIEQVKSGSDDIVKDLGLDEDKFVTVPHKSILDNPNDIAIGVIKVKIKDNLSVFGIFKIALIKYVDNGEIIYILYTTTTDYLAIEGFSKTLFEKLGLGLYDSDRDYTFKDSPRIKQLATGSHEEDKSIVNVWLTEKYSVVLQYMVDPLHQFVLRITKKVLKKINRDIRRGTILDLIAIDLSQILTTEEIYESQEMREDGTISFVDYKFRLKEPILDVFDILNARIFSNERVFNLSTQAHLTLTSSTQRELPKIIRICDDIMKIYGSDWSGNFDLEIGEVDALEKNEFWTGRRWHLNEVNALRIPSDNTPDVYWIEISNGITEAGFTLHIGCYNNLIAYFATD